MMLDAGGLDSLIGHKFNGYRVTRFIARGGMGMVFEGVQESLNRPVAIKFLYPHLSDSPGLRDRFQREGLAAARLSHPHIVRIIDFGVDGLLCYMVLDFIAGESLREFVVREYAAGRILGREPCIRILRQIGGALTYAHGLGFVHRDVKPSNILLSQNGESYLTDFGVVKILGESQLTATGTLVGTPEYMAPEQASGETEINAAADQYSFAVVAYEMVLGRVPFQAPTPLGVIRMHMSDPPPAPSSFRPGFPPAAAAVLMRGLAKDPAQRYPTVDAFVDDLVGAMEQREASSSVASGSPVLPAAGDVPPHWGAPDPAPRWGAPASPPHWGASASPPIQNDPPPHWGAPASPPTQSGRPPTLTSPEVAMVGPATPNLVRRQLDLIMNAYGYNLYEKKNRARADDQLVRERVGSFIGESAVALRNLRTEYRRRFVPPPSRDQPSTAPAHLEALAALARLQERLEGLETRVRSMSVPTADRAWDHFRNEKGLLTELLLRDYNLIGPAQQLREAAQALRAESWSPDAERELGQLADTIARAAQERADFLAAVK